MSDCKEIGPRDQKEVRKEKGQMRGKRQENRSQELGVLGVLEMIPGEPNAVSGGPNEEFTRPLIEYRKCGKSFAEGENAREIRDQIRVVPRRVSLHLFIVEGENLLEEESREKKKRAKGTSEPRNQ